MRKNYSYDTYRGRSPFRSVLKWIIALLAVVLILAVAALVWLQQYMVYSSDGGKLVFPWTEQSTPFPSQTPSSAPPLVSPSVVVISPDIPAPEALHAAFLPREALYDGSAEQALLAAGAQAAVFDMKADDGTLAYVSAQALAIQANASSADPAVNAAIQELNRLDGLYTVARVSCFKDNKLSDADWGLSITTNSGYRWSDPDDLRWSSPAHQTVQAYVTAVCVELAALGFDEILLDNAGYPTQGNLAYIKPGAAYDKSQLSTVIGSFYKDVRAALADYPGVKLSVVTDRSTLESGQDALSGQTLSALAESADRIWAADIGAGWSTCVKSLQDSGFPDPEINLVSIQDAQGSEERSWSLWM